MSRRARSAPGGVFWNRRGGPVLMMQCTACITLRVPLPRFAQVTEKLLFIRVYRRPSVAFLGSLPLAAEAAKIKEPYAELFLKTSK